MLLWQSTVYHPQTAKFAPACNALKTIVPWLKGPLIWLCMSGGSYLLSDNTTFANTDRYLLTQHYKYTTKRDEIQYKTTELNKTQLTLNCQYTITCCLLAKECCRNHTVFQNWDNSAFRYFGIPEFRYFCISVLMNYVCYRIAAFGNFAFCSSLFEFSYYVVSGILEFPKSEFPYPDISVFPYLVI